MKTLLHAIARLFAFSNVAITNTIEPYKYSISKLIFDETPTN